MRLLIRKLGLDDLLIECGIFGQGVMETVLNGKHYYRALAGLLMLEDLIGCLQWKAFFLTHDHTDYPYFHVLENLAKSLTENKEQATEFNEAIAIVGPLKRDFNEFLKTCEARSEVCKFLGILLYIISLVKNLVASDREGNWDLHVSTVADAIPIFKECDCLHYLRNGGYYSETIKAMEFSDPWLFRKFKSGLWAIQEKSGKFRAVGGDMKMEQGLQCVSKGPGGHYVVGLSGNAAAVAEFELLFPEAGKIASFLSMIIAESSSQHRDFLLQSCFNKKRKHVFNLNVISLLDFISAERNMYTVTTATPLCPTPLHNFMNSQKVDTQRAARLLNLVENGREGWTQHRQAVFVDKTKKLSAKLKTTRLPSFGPNPIEKKNIALQTKNDLTPKAVGIAEKSMALVRERGMSTSEILTHDLIPICPLFEGDFPTQAKKSQLVTEISPMTRTFTSKWDRTSAEPTAIHVDFMSRARRQPLHAYATIGELLTAVLDSAAAFCTSDYVHLLLDSYIEFSLKEPERLRRNDETEGIDIVNLSESSPTPQQKELFWSSENNKSSLQKLLRDMSLKRPDKPVVYLSSMIEDGELLPAIRANGDPSDVTELSEWIEEADDQIILHVNYSIKHHNVKRHVVLSNDTDSFVLLLRYTPYFLSCGATEIWLNFGIGDFERMIPMHEVSATLGLAQSLTMIKAHMLTGGDIHSKVGTKHAAVKMNPDKYLSNFGETSVLSEDDLALAEEYLVKVVAGVNSKPSAKTFDAYRQEKYTSTATSLNDLPPTSTAIRSHIQRVAYSVYTACNLLVAEKDNLVPQDHGWEERCGVMLPVKSLKLLPDHMLLVCGCKGRCDSKKCKCTVAGVSCTIFCHGKTKNQNCSKMQY